MASLNKVQLIGNIGKDPEIRMTNNGKKVAKFSLATTDKFGDNVNTDWHNITVWEKLADVVEKFVRKGSQVYIEGRISYRSYDDSEGNKRYSTDIIANSLQLLGKKEQSGDKMSASGNVVDDDLPF